MINMGTSIYSTAGYSQFLVYQKYNPNTFIDSNTKKAINVQFDISSISSMDSANISILIAYIQFYIFHANSQFFLYIVNLDY